MSAAGEARPTQMNGLTPAEIVSELDRYIVGQHLAKKAVAIALRNRWRRQNLPRSCGTRWRPRTSS